MCLTAQSVMDCDNKYQQLCFLTHVEEQLSTTLSFQCQLLKTLSSIELTTTQQSMLHDMLSEQALPVSFQSARIQTTAQLAQRLFVYNLGTMLH